LPEQQTYDLMIKISVHQAAAISRIISVPNWDVNERPIGWSRSKIQTLSAKPKSGARSSSNRGGVTKGQ